MSALELVYNHPVTTIFFVVFTWWPFCVGLAALAGMRGARK